MFFKRFILYLIYIGVICPIMTKGMFVLSAFCVSICGGPLHVDQFTRFALHLLVICCSLVVVMFRNKELLRLAARVWKFKCLGLHDVGILKNDEDASFFPLWILFLFWFVELTSCLLLLWLVLPLQSLLGGICGFFSSICFGLLNLSFVRGKLLGFSLEIKKKSPFTPWWFIHTFEANV